MYIRQGYEVYNVNITFQENEKNVESLLDCALSGADYEFNIKSIDTEDAYPTAKLLVEIPFIHKHTDAFCDGHGINPPEDEMYYSGMAPDELQSYLEDSLHAFSVTIDFERYNED